MTENLIIINKIKELEKKSLSLPLSLADTSNVKLEIEDVNDDFKRETAFQTQALDSVKRVRDYFLKNDLKFTRPDDYFAEMIKSDAHMERIRQHIIEEKQSVERAEDAKRRREQKKYGKTIQAQKRLEKQEHKAKEMEKIKLLKKRKRSQEDNGDDEFEVEISDGEEASAQPNKQEAYRASKGKKPNAKRDYKNKKFGFGGKKRMLKVNDKESSADMASFNPRKNKALPKSLGGQTRKGAARPGKSKRQKKVNKK